MTFPTYKTSPVDALIPYARNSRTHSDEQAFTGNHAVLESTGHTFTEVSNARGA